MQDAPLAQQSAASLRATMAAKASGAARLASSTLAAPLTTIVHFSSLSALLGTAGQANYAAANEVLNSRAAAQLAAGAPAVALAWGPWATGMAAKDPRIGARLERAGLGTISPAVGLAALAHALSASRSRAGANTVMARIDWPLLMTVSKAAAAAPVFASFHASAAPRPGQPFTALSGAMPHASAAAAPRSAPTRGLSKAAVQVQLQEIVAAMLGPGVSVDAPLMESGLDSLSAVELRNNLSGLFGTPLPATVTFDYPSISALAGYIAQQAAEAAAAAAGMLGSAGSAVLGSAAALLGRGPSVEQVRAQLQGMVEGMLGTAVPTGQPLMEADLDSLSAVELRNSLANTFRLDSLPATLMFDYPSIDALAGYIANRIGSTPESQIAAPQWEGTLAPQPDLGYALGGAQAGSYLTEVIGASARYPGDTRGVSGFWATASGAFNLQRRVPLERWDAELLYAPVIVPGSMAVNAPFAAFCERVAEFDAAAFGLSPTEAVTVDPQQRLLMEETAGALGDAALRTADNIESLTSAIGGCSCAALLSAPTIHRATALTRQWSGSTIAAQGSVDSPDPLSNVIFLAAQTQARLLGCALTTTIECPARRCVTTSSDTPCRRVRRLHVPRVAGRHRCGWHGACAALLRRQRSCLHGRPPELHVRPDRALRQHRHRMLVLAHRCAPRT